MLVLLRNLSIFFTSLVGDSFLGKAYCTKQTWGVKGIWFQPIWSSCGWLIIQEKSWNYYIWRSPPLLDWHEDWGYRVTYLGKTLRLFQHLWFSLIWTGHPAVVLCPGVHCRHSQVFPNQGESPVRCHVVAIFGGSPEIELMSHVVESCWQELSYWVTAFQCPGCGKAWDSTICLGFRGRGKNKPAEDKQRTRPLCYSCLHNLGLFIRIWRLEGVWSVEMKLFVTIQTFLKLLKQYHSRVFLGLDIILNNLNRIYIHRACIYLALEANLEGIWCVPSL